MTRCNRCTETNTELKSFNIEVRLDKSTIINAGIKGWIGRSINRLLGTTIVADIHICQSCISSMFRSCHRDK